MKLQELRLNNWVNNEAGFPEQISIDDFPMFDIYSPIPLDEDWLKRFGFENEDHHRYNRWANDEFQLEIQGDKYAYYIWDSEAPQLTHFLGHCKHVHSLQNLFFALTNSELTTS